jgi:hypothetical protein
MSKVEVNQISSQCGSTLTIGQSGDTVTLACGATQTGFGRTGTVDWDTTAKTASFTAVSGNGYFVNTTSTAITLTLPATPSAGDIVAFKDYAGTFGTNNLTIARNGSNLDGNAADKVIDTSHTSMSLVYVDGTQGWKSVEEGTGFLGENHIVGTGGTITTCGDYKIHTFTSPGTFTISSVADCAANNVVDYLVIAGGGGGIQGAGGAGGYRESSGAATGCYTVSPLGACVSALPVTATDYPVTVGSGGSFGRQDPLIPGSNGSNSVFSTITSTGGGKGGLWTGCGSNGSSGGGGGGKDSPSGPAGAGGTGNTPPVSPPQGNDGGDGFAGPSVTNAGNGGGGGATAVGSDGSYCGQAIGGNGGSGGTSSINGTPTGRGGGGGGGTVSNSSSTNGTGADGGGNGGKEGIAPSGTANTGGGGGGGGYNSGFGTGGSGGSGIVIIRYKYQ